jgi:phosphatidylinositol alpha-mannosyltransferase
VKIGIVSQSYYPKPGGVTEVVHYTARELERRGHQVTIITTRYGGEEPQSGTIRIGRNILLPVNGAWVNVTAGIGLKRTLREIFLRERFDIIHTHCPLVPTLPLLALAAAGPAEKIVGTFHATARSNVLYRLFRKALDARACRLDRRIAVSEPARRFAYQYFPGRYEIVPNGIDCTRFRPDIPPFEHLRDGYLNILYVGRMDKRKGLPFLLRALPAAGMRINRPLRLILVGEGKLRRMLMPRPLGRHGVEIMAVGRVSPVELPRYYASADIFCSPATGQESFGIVLLEAMATGIPVIASDIPGYRSVVTDGQDGLLVQPRDPEALARTLCMLAGNDTLRAALGARGRKKALTFNWPTITEQLERIYTDMAGTALKRAAPELVEISAR